MLHMNYIRYGSKNSFLGYIFIQKIMKGLIRGMRTEIFTLQDMLYSIYIPV